MYLTGFADEAGADIDTQIRATKELGWENIEVRRAGSANLHDIPEDEFEAVAAKLHEAGIHVNCFGSTIANWGKKIDEPFDSSLEEAKRAIPRMKRLGTKMVRIMSFALLPDRAPDEQMKEERFRRLNILQKMFADEGLLPVHENCNNYGGMGYTYTLELIENVPGLKLVYDTGNPVHSKDYTKPEPRPQQSSWEFYGNVKEHIAYVHIKDGEFNPETGKATYGWPGEGEGDVKRIVKDLLDNGYDGGFSMEPHIAVVFHDASVTAPEEVKYANYVEYGKRFEDLVREIGHGDKL